MSKHYELQLHALIEQLRTLIIEREEFEATAWAEAYIAGDMRAALAHLQTAHQKVSKDKAEVGNEQR